MVLSIVCIICAYVYTVRHLCQPTHAQTGWLDRAREDSVVYTYIMRHIAHHSITHTYTYTYIHIHIYHNIYITYIHIQQQVVAAGSMYVDRQVAVIEQQFIIIRIVVNNRIIRPRPQQCAVEICQDPRPQKFFSKIRQIISKIFLSRNYHILPYLPISDIWQILSNLPVYYIYQILALC